MEMGGGGGGGDVGEMARWEVDLQSGSSRETANWAVAAGC